MDSRPLFPLKLTFRNPQENISFKDKYQPKSIYQFVLRHPDFKQICHWFQSIGQHGSEALFFSGPPSTGKTSAAKIFSQHYGFTVKEFNALDGRNKKMIESIILKMLDHKPIDSHLYPERKYLLLIDELECLADKNSLNLMIKLLNGKKNKNIELSLPIIFISNETTEKKINELKKYCTEITFQRPQDADISRLFLRILGRESLQIHPNDLAEILPVALEMINSDYRRLLQLTEFLSSFLQEQNTSCLTLHHFNLAKTIYGAKYIDYDIYQNTMKTFTTINLKESIRLYESGKSLLPMMIHENYNHLLAQKYHNQKQKQITLSLKAINSIIQGDLIDKIMYNTQSWHYSTIHCLNSCYLPVYYSWGIATKPLIRFTTTLGKHSLQSSNKKKFLTLLSNIGNGKSYNSNDLYYLGNIIRYHALNKNGDLEVIKQMMQTYNLNFDVIEKLIRFSKSGDNQAFTGKIKIPLKKSLQNVKIRKSHLYRGSDQGERPGGAPLPL